MAKRCQLPSICYGNTVIRIWIGNNTMKPVQADSPMRINTTDSGRVNNLHGGVTNSMREVVTKSRNQKVYVPVSSAVSRICKARSGADSIQRMGPEENRL